ncbi:MAG: iron ABC transporter permease, partial [Spirulinaceae cyanobacterium]
MSSFSLAKSLSPKAFFPKVLQGWTVFVTGIALLIATPIIFVLSSIFSDAREIWTHLATTVLSGYILNSLSLMLGVGVGVLLIGVSTAWLVTACRFPGSKIFEWALLLPLAIPAYLLAYTYTELLDYYGPVQTWLRNAFGWQSIQEYWFPPVRSLGGAIIMLFLVLYPYVYLIARVAFLEQSVRTLEASRSLGRGPWRSFFTVALPLARPAIMGGLALALMETLGDFGTVDYFGVTTFTTGIYRTWLGMGEPVAAAQLAAFLMLFVLTLIVSERWFRRQARYYDLGHAYESGDPYQLKGMRSLVAGLTCLLPVTLGFLLPAGLLLKMTWENAAETLDQDFWQLAFHSFVLATLTAAVAVIVALIIAYGHRLNRNLTMNSAVRIASMGYAIPGSVIAVGVVIPLAQFDNWLDSRMETIFGISTGLLLTGTIIALIFAYLVRFLAVSFNTVESSLTKIKPSLDDAARSLGHSPSSTLVKVHAPLMLGGMLTAVMLVFVDVMKE